MKSHHLLVVTLPLLLAACGDGTESESQNRLGQEAKEWGAQTKELGKAAWDATKEAAGSAAEKSKEMYETAKAKTGEYYESTKEASKEAYEAAKQKSAEYYDTAKERATKAYQAAKGEEGDMAESAHGAMELSPEQESAGGTEVQQEPETDAAQEAAGPTPSEPAASQ